MYRPNTPSADLPEKIEELLAARQSLLAVLPREASGLEWCDRHTEIADALLGIIYADVERECGPLPPISLVATGGYGRRELAPYSDVDLTVIPLDESATQLDQAVRMLFRSIHAGFAKIGLQVGYAYRLIGDAPGLDPKTRTGLLDARLVAGSHRPLDVLLEAFWENFPVGEFLLDKIEEREAMIRKHNDTPLAVEPQLKEGAGGMRCVQCANWIGMAIGERPKRPTKAYETVLRTRNVLHAVAGKAVDLFSRQRQGEVADALGLDLFEMGSELADALEDNHRQFLLATEQLHEARFPLGSHVLAMRGEVRLAAGAELSEAAFGVAIATQLGLRIADLKAVTQAHVDGGMAMAALAKGEATLRNLDRCGVLEALLPELAICRTLMPGDSSHSFTVFEHTLRVVRNLDQPTAGFLAEIRAGLGSPSTLYLAALLHDVGKAVEGVPHSESGEVIARAIAGRWRLDSNTADDVCWLVLKHLEMARFIRMRDVMHPQTAFDFAELVGSTERLKMLTLLTWADVSAVAPGSWTQVQETFLRELFERTMSVLESEGSEAPNADNYRQRIIRRLQSSEARGEELEAFIDSLPAHYLLSTSPELIEEHFAFAQKALQGEMTVDIFHSAQAGVTELTVCALDSPGFLSQILGVIYALNCSLHGVRACTTSVEPEVAVDVFTVSFGGKPLPPATCAQLSKHITSVLRAETTIDDILRSKGKDPGRRQEIDKWTYLEGHPGILEFTAPRGRGMAYRLSSLIAQQGWNTLAARLGQWAGKGAAAFYIEGPQGTTLTKDHVTKAFSGKV